MRTARWGLVVGAMLLASCDAFGPEDVEVLLQTDTDVYTAPGAVLVQLVNLSPGTLHHGVCFVLEQRVGEEWIDATDYGAPCPLPRMITKPLQQRTLGALVYEPGEYRLLFWVSTADEQRVEEPFVTNSFTVVAPAP